MSDQPKKQRTWKSVLSTTVVFLVLYVLSTGPVYWLETRGLLFDEDGFLGHLTQCFYNPLLWLALKSDAFFSFFYWYIELWSP